MVKGFVRYELNENVKGTDLLEVGFSEGLETVKMCRTPYYHLVSLTDNVIVGFEVYYDMNGVSTFNDLECVSFFIGGSGDMKIYDDRLEYVPNIEEVIKKYNELVYFMMDNGLFKSTSEEKANSTIEEIELRKAEKALKEEKYSKKLSLVV